MSGVSISTILHVCNAYHLSDCIHTMIMFKNIDIYLKKHNIYIYFYCTENNFRQINDFNSSYNVIVKTCNEIPKDIYVHNLWIGNTKLDYTYYHYLHEYESRDNINHTYDSFLCKFYNNFLKSINIPHKIENFVYWEDDLYVRCEHINKRTNYKYQNIDFLINNTIPTSGEFQYSLDEWNQFIKLLSHKYNIVTTQKVDNIKCTTDDNLTAKDIAAISTNIKKFIMIESGVTSVLFNKYITESTNVVVYYLSNFDHHKTSFPNFIFKKNLRDLYFLLDNYKDPQAEKWYENLEYTKVYSSFQELANEYPNVYNDEAIIFLVNNNGGFASQLALLVQYSLYIKSINTKLHCLGHFSVNTPNFKYHEEKLHNSFFLYFDYLKPIEKRIRYYFVKIYDVLENYPFLKTQNFDGGSVNDIEINNTYSSYFKEHFKPRQNVFSININDIESIKQSTNIPLIGIHLRAISKNSADLNKTSSIVDIVEKLKNIFDNKYGKYNIYVATDVEDYINVTTSVFKDSLVFYNKTITRISNKAAKIIGDKRVYQDTICNLSEYSGFKLGSDIMIDCLSLVHCNYYYTSTSNISFMTSFMSKQANGFHYN